MNIVELLKAALYGLVEGITEWLPVSSTGHMLLLKQFVTLDVTKDFWDMFLVVIQLGAILAVCVMFFGALNPFSKAKSTQERKGTWRLWGQIIVACLPAAAIGIPLDDWMEDHLGSPFVIAAALIFYGIAFIAIETAREHKAERIAIERSFKARPQHFKPNSQPVAPSKAALADVDARVQSIGELGWGTAIGIGIFQVLSMVPGTSRSGSTIIGAAEFTFYLAIPVMVGASGLRLVKFFLKGNAFTSAELAILCVGCLAAFVVSILVIRFLMGFIKKHDFKPRPHNQGTHGFPRPAIGSVLAIAGLLVHN